MAVSGMDSRPPCAHADSLCDSVTFCRRSLHTHHIFRSAMVLLMNGAAHPVWSILRAGSLQVISKKPRYSLKERNSPQEMLFIDMRLLLLKILFLCFEATLS